MRIFLLCMALVQFSWTASAQPNVIWMNDDDIQTAFTGTTVSGIYADGMIFTETYASSGGITYRDSRKAMTGRWSVVNQTFCTLYDSATSGGCFKVSRVSSNCFEFYFTAGNESEAASDNQRRPSWTARGWDKAKPATCDDKPVV